MTSPQKEGAALAPALDPRAQRSRERLAAAILDLAADHDAGSLTASQVAAAAGVNRSTFYQHAASPVALLHQVLSTELDALRSGNLTATDNELGDAIRAVTAGVVQHVDQHRRIYRRGLNTDAGPAGLHAMLGGHFEASVRLVLESRGITVSARDGRRVPAAMVARFIAYGVVGAFESRLLEDTPRAAGDFLADLSELLPAWWPIG
ncbi:TetR family transcriptional regulator [Arthrobacter sp. ZBG10]|jgi:AcrR family transcriptional regulator|uniref:TetR/AcrR family transcriptional regulator n=1 Tax=Micrococcaceae TaxID=1268 RepID=UPI00067F917E|nr:MULTISPECIES: TetR/AcrR family transcriptional regulator [Micrococcaceae]KNH17853.1 TetR family transcriptional regulator [Arthrobacter sp. ZBG10]KQR00049.1 TetR family transcriptional regulator [Arthrobacter sp. Leaf141]